MNGYLLQLLLGALNVTVGIVVILVGIVLKQHKEGDDEHKAIIDKEIDNLRTKMHEVMNKISAIEAMEYMRDKK